MNEYELEGQIDELTIEEVAEYAAELGHQLAIYGDGYGLYNRGKLFAIGTLEELTCLLDSIERYSDLAEVLSPTPTTIH